MRRGRPLPRHPAHCGKTRKTVHPARACPPLSRRACMRQPDHFSSGTSAVRPDSQPVHGPSRARQTARQTPSAAGVGKGVGQDNIAQLFKCAMLQAACPPERRRFLPALSSDVWCRHEEQHPRARSSSPPLRVEALRISIPTLTRTVEHCTLEQLCNVLRPIGRSAYAFGGWTRGARTATIPDGMSRCMPQNVGSLREAPTFRAASFSDRLDAEGRPRRPNATSTPARPGSSVGSSRGPG